MLAPTCPPDAPTVFVVDDDEAVRAALGFALEMQGFNARTCESGEALLLQQLPPSRACLVVDQRLPGITGLETLRQLRDREVALPAVIVTSNPKPELRAAAADMGVPILEKPLLGDTLTNFIRTALEA